MIEERVVQHITVHWHWLVIGGCIAIKHLAEAFKAILELYWNWKDKVGGQIRIR
jgi:hypothetical protein